MFKSDPEITQTGVSGQYGQFSTWMADPEPIVSGNHDDPTPQFLPCGRLRLAPQYFTLQVTWKDLKPPQDQQDLFKEVLLIRDEVRLMLPSTPIWFIHTTDSPLPLLCYKFHHWMSNTLNPDDKLNPVVGGLADIRWFLFYGDASGLTTASFTSLIDETSLPVDYQTFDSSLSGGDEAISGSGWFLVMAKRELTQAPPGDVPVEISGITISQSVIPTTIFMIQETPPIFVTHHIYGAWQLKQPVNLIKPTTEVPDPVQPPGPYSVATEGPRTVYGPEAIFDPLQNTTWTIVKNLLLWPEHTLTLLPFRA